ncbi:MAG: threonylcarbamoyl-AMP synthase [Oscillospiraceae bacterium]|nr:threonylcarbamoyl-AMP synthase [Oscillospiraceae bacterium]
MQTRVIKVEEDNFREAMEEATKLLAEGELVGIPTETVYGLAASAYSNDAVDKIFEAKGRPQDNPLIVHISDMDMIDKVAVDIPEKAYELADKFWPGPLTMILKKHSNICDHVTCGQETVAVRLPSHPVAKELIRFSQIPLAAPSANLSGKPSTTTAQHVLDDHKGKIALILDGGPCEFGVESTIVSLIGEHPILLRPGVISIEMIREICPDATVSDAVFHPLHEGEKVLSPGLKYKHYSPNADVILVDGELDDFCRYVAENAKGRTFAMCFDGEESTIPCEAVAYGKKGDGISQAKNVFSILREMDELGADTVFVRAPEESGVSMAVDNRLLRAAGFRVIKV